MLNKSDVTIKNVFKFINVKYAKVSSSETEVQKKT